MVPTQFADFGRIVDSAGLGCPEPTRSHLVLAVDVRGTRALDGTRSAMRGETSEER